MAKRVDYQKYQQFCKEACLKAGLSEEVSAVTARMLVRTDMLGIYTHGTLNLLPYLEKLPVGGIDGSAMPVVASEGKTWAVVDGQNAMPVYNGWFGLQKGIEKAREYGMAYVGIRNSGHYGACGVYAVEAAEQGLIAIVMSNTLPNMAVPGGKGAVIGNSPICYAIPAGDHRPVFMDIATSNVAGMKVVRKQAAGEEVPLGWIVDKDGQPTTTPVPGNWVLCPFGNHKGYGFSFFIEAMCAVLTGSTAFDVKLWMTPETPANVSHSLILINMPEIMDADAFGKSMVNAIDTIAGAPKAEGVDRIYLPGEIEWDRFEKAEKEGLELPDDIVRNAEKLAEKFGLQLAPCFL